MRHHAAVQSPPAWECFSRTTFHRDVLLCLQQAKWWQDHVEGILLSHQGRGQELIHIFCQQSCWSQSQAFFTGLSLLWTNAINKMFLIPQPYQDQPKLQPLEIHLPDCRWKINTLRAASQSCCTIKQKNKTKLSLPDLSSGSQPSPRRGRKSSILVWREWSDVSQLPFHPGSLRQKGTSHPH